MNQGLSKREREVLLLKANGNTRQHIASWLGITKGTVDDHLGSIYRKLHAANDVHAAAIGIAVGEIGLHEIIIPGNDAA